MRALVLTVCLFLAACGQKPLPVLGDIPHFQLTDHLGRAFSSITLDGHVWVADFVFTNCEGPCPRMSSHMRNLQSQTDAGVKLISFTVDPARDTPQVLAEYSKKFGTDSKRWLFLTGDVATLNMLDQDAFKLGSIGGEIEHSTRYALVDKKGHIRGYYGISEGDPARKIARDIAKLEKETS
jgi:cytochrome oxidase Cu insertion factor (SCO1/SenC/PrrC family)